VKKNRSWFALVTFCATTSLAAAIGLAIVFSGATIAFAGADTSEVASSKNAVGSVHTQVADSVPGRTFSGMITDDRCGARHQRNSDKSPSECARMCVRNGSKYMLVDGDKKYTLDGNADGLDKLAGQRASIVGTLDGNTIRVSSISSGQ